MEFYFQLEVMEYKQIAIFEKYLSDSIEDAKLIRERVFWSTPFKVTYKIIVEDLNAVYYVGVLTTLFYLKIKENQSDLAQKDIKRKLLKQFEFSVN